MRDDLHGANVPQVAGNPQYPSLHRLTPVPIAAGADGRLTKAALRLIINVSGYSDENGWCPLSHREHADLARLNRNTIGRTLRTLVAIGYLAVAHNLYDPQRHRRAHTAYRVTDPTPVDPATAK